MGRPKKVIETVAPVVPEAAVPDVEQKDAPVEQPKDPIVEQPSTPAKEPAKGKSYVIANPFVDKDNFSKSYNPGDDVPASFDKERIENLLKLGLIKEK